MHPAIKRARKEHQGRDAFYPFICSFLQKQLHRLRASSAESQLMGRAPRPAHRLSEINGSGGLLRALENTNSLHRHRN